MTGYVTGDLIDPDGANELLATAEQSISCDSKARHSSTQPAWHGLGQPGPAHQAG
jgi:hypothetical protein